MALHVNNAWKRVQNGGWARQVTQYDFQISGTIAGVNMRLAAGGLRELHWRVFGKRSLIATLHRVRAMG